MKSADKQTYIFFVDSYGTDSFGCACVKTQKKEVQAASDAGAKRIARRREDVSKIERPDGTTIMETVGSNTYEYSTSRYAIGC